MSYIVPKEIPNCCGRCPCFHAEHPMYCQAVKADKNKRIYAPYGEGRPDWCPLIEVPTPHGRLIDADALESKIRKQYCEDCDRRKGIKNGKMRFCYEIGDAPCRACSVDDMCAELDDAPTVIEAEETE